MVQKLRRGADLRDGDGRDGGRRAAACGSNAGPAQIGFLPNMRANWADFKAAWADAGIKNVAKLMLPALLGVGVAHISAIINLQIASHLTPGSVSWMSYAERLMEFPTAMLGVALGVVLTPRLVAAKASGDDKTYSAMIDWGLRLVVLLAVPCTVALLLFCQAAGGDVVPLRRVHRQRRAASHHPADGLRRWFGWLDCHQNFGTRFLRQPGHQNPGQNRHCGADHYAVAEYRLGAAVCPRGIGFGYWLGGVDQRAVAADWFDEARQLQALARLG